MNYITALNQLIVAATAQIPNVVLYGENINTGSHICGMTRHLRLERGGRILNVGDCESTHCGVGFGLMLNGVSSVLFCKQLDFIVLGIDHFISTYNVIRTHRSLASLGSFTICVIVCDQGFQGPQSSFNALGDLCSLARVPGYTLTNQQDASHVLGRQFTATGFRFVALSQRLFPTECLTPDLVYAAEDASVFQYSVGRDATIACFNFSLPEGRLLQAKLLEQGLTTSLFSVNHVLPGDWARIKESVAQTGRLVVMDDSKGVNSAGYRLLSDLAASGPPFHQVMVTRERVEFGVSADTFDVDYDGVMSRLAVGVTGSVARSSV